MNSSKFHLLLRLAVVSLLIGFIASPMARAAAPHLLAYEGRITVSGTTFTGTGQFKFALVNADGSETYWSNDGTSVAGSAPTASVNVPVNGGLYTVLLGSGMQEVSPTIFKQHDDVHLRVWFNDGVNGFHLLSPDQRIASVGYAMGVPAGSVSSSEIADGSVTAEKLGILSSSPNANGLNLVLNDLGHANLINATAFHSGQEVADVKILRSNAADPIEDEEANLTVLESQLNDTAGNTYLDFSLGAIEFESDGTPQVSLLEAELFDAAGNTMIELSLAGTDVDDGEREDYIMQSSAAYNTTNTEMFFNVGTEWGLLDAGLRTYPPGYEEGDDNIYPAQWRLFPRQNGVPEDQFLQFMMREENWGTTSLANWSVYSNDGGNWQSQGYFQVFPSDNGNGLTSLRLGVDAALHGTHLAMEADGPVLVWLDPASWSSRQALEVQGPARIIGDLSVAKIRPHQDEGGAVVIDGHTHVYGNLRGWQQLHIDSSAWIGGDLHVNGFLSKSGGGFRIDHPLDPDNKTLTHSFVESPDMKNFYDGLVTTSAEGRATVELPSYFEALNKDFRYQLTVVGAEFAQVRVSRKIENNRFEIATDKPGIEVSWQVTGIRKDAWAEANRPQV